MNKAQSVKHRRALQDRGPQLPEEILEKIILLVEIPSDLLVFALSCRKLHRIIVPEYLSETTHAVVHLHDHERWRWITANAHRTRSLRILPGDAQAPATCTDDVKWVVRGPKGNDNVGEKVLERAVERMKGLRSLEVDCMFSNLATDLNGARWDMPSREALEILTRAPIASLRYNIYCDEQPTWVSQRTFVNELSSRYFDPPWTLSNLTEFNLNQVSFWKFEGLGMNMLRRTLMFDMLVDRCPRLERLTLRIPDASLEPLFQRAQWPFLTHLDIFSDMNDMAQHSITTTQLHPVHDFFKRNQGITHLRLRTSSPYTNGVVNTSIIGAIRDAPRLRAVELEPDCLHLLHRDTARQIVRLSTIMPLGPGEHWGRTLGGVGPGRMPALRVLGMTSKALGILFGVTPCSQVESLDYRLYTKADVHRRSEWIKIVSLFPNITCLRKNSDRPTGRLSSLFKFDETAVFRDLAEVGRRLEYVVVEEQWYRVIRKEGGYYASASVVPPEPSHQGSPFVAV